MKSLRGILATRGQVGMRRSWSLISPGMSRSLRTRVSVSGSGSFRVDPTSARPSRRAASAPASRSRRSGVGLLEGLAYRAPSASVRRATSAGSGPVGPVSSSPPPSSSSSRVGIESRIGGRFLDRQRFGFLDVVEADHDLGQALLARLVRRSPRAASGSTTGSWPARTASGSGLPRCVLQSRFRPRASAARPCPSRACTCAPGQWCGHPASSADSVAAASSAAVSSTSRPPAELPASNSVFGIGRDLVHLDAHAR